MDPDRILVAAGLTAAAVVGAFVFWGPTTGVGGRRGRLVGLVNLGQTCFLNTLLQALAACPTFVAWLEYDKHCKETSLKANLRMVISVINGTNRSSRMTNRDGSYIPDAIMKSLKRLGWVIPPGEQDAHELFHVILSSLAEESTTKKIDIMGSLSDILNNEMDDSPDEDETFPLTRSGPLSLQGDYINDGNNLSSTSTLSLCDATASEPGDDPGGICYSRRPGSLQFRYGSISQRHRWLSQSCRGLGIGSPAYMLSEHPFNGTIATQLKCTECGFKPPVRYDKFESLTLTLPNEIGAGAWGKHKLHRLLADFVAPEIVNGVACDGCNKGLENEGSPLRSKHVKVVYFGKLPACLCIHLSRCTWTAGLGAGKRQDPVQFPEKLSLAAYTYLQSYQSKRLPTQMFNSSSEGGSPLSSSMPHAWAGITGLMEGPREVRHLYQLYAVVVHMGSANSGHFATYKRGPTSFAHNKWFYASDTEIRESCIEEVLQSNAYMLFYEKTSRSEIY